jgi:hypothetical protein
MYRVSNIIGNNTILEPLGKNQFGEWISISHKGNVIHINGIPWQKGQHVDGYPDEDGREFITRDGSYEITRTS